MRIPSSQDDNRLRKSIKRSWHGKCDTAERLRTIPERTEEVKAFKRILVPTDYSDLSLAALDYALLFSQVFGAEIVLLHTLDTIPVLALDTMDLTTETVIYETEQNAKKDLHLFAISRAGNIPNLVELVRRGVAEDQIVQVAREENIDLIVMATHGRSGLAHVLLGSVAEKVVQRSSVPVLTVKPASVSGRESEYAEAKNGNGPQES